MTNSTIVAISDGGSATDRACYSDDGAATFALAAMPTFANGSGGSWRAVAYSPVLGRFVAVADHGNNSNAIAYSDDGGQTWTGVAFANEGSYVFTDICYSPDLDLFVIVAAGGPDTTKRIITSSDGAAWAEVDLPDAGKSLRVVEWSRDLGIFCAVGDSYGVTSDDGAAWTAMSAHPGFSTCYDICWCGGSVQKFLAVGSGVVASVSADGDSWTDQSAPYCGTSSVGYACAWSDALGLAAFSSANSGKLSYTSDLATGSVGQTIGSRVEGLCWAATAGVFVAVGSDFVYASGDGTSWASQTAASGSWKYVVEGTEAGPAPPPPLDLSAALADESTLDAAATIIPPTELAANLSDGATLSAALTIGTAEIGLSADFADEASLAAALTVGAPRQPIDLGQVGFFDESTLAAQLSFPIDLQAALADDATLAPALTVMPPIPPPVQCVVVLTG